MSVLFKTYSTYLAKKMRENDEANFKNLKHIEGVKSINNIRYFKGKNKYHLFNMYFPESASDLSTLPLMIQIHGGGWIYGDKDLSRFHNAYYASKGMVVLSMSYRLLLRTNLKGIVQDLFHFFNYIEKHKEELNISFKNVLLTGDSAGGHLVLLVNAINQNKDLQELYEVEPFNIKFKMLNLEHPVPFLKEIFNKKGTRIANHFLMNAFFGYFYKKKTLYYNSSLEDFIDKSKYPFISIVSSSDDSFKDQTIKTYEELKKRGNEVSFKMYQDEPHVFEVSFYDRPKSLDYNNYVINKFKELIGNSYEKK